MNRHFRRDGDWPGVGRGSVWLEFERDWATRQVELYDGRWYCSDKEYHPELGPGLTDRPLWEHEFAPEEEITAAEFEVAWDRATQFSVQEQVKRLITEELQRKGERLPPGASDEDIAAFEVRTGLQVPQELRELLRWSNGPPVGPSGIYRLDPRDCHGGIELHYEFHPGWRKRGWIPIAGDGCGDNYLLDTSVVVGHDPRQLTLPTLTPLAAGTHPVYFKDHETDSEALPEYVVASGLWTFLHFWLLRDRRGHTWPFDRKCVLAEDPALTAYQGDVPLPWDLDQ
jgi:hypothetical protein